MAILAFADIAYTQCCLTVNCLRVMRSFYYKISCDMLAAGLTNSVPTDIVYMYVYIL